jgi:hypothetical protein
MVIALPKATPECCFRLPATVERATRSLSLCATRSTRDEYAAAASCASKEQRLVA